MSAGFVVPTATVSHFLDANHYLGATGRGFAWSDEFGVIVLAKPTARRLPQDGTWLELVRWWPARREERRLSSVGSRSPLPHRGAPGRVDRRQLQRPERRPHWCALQGVQLDVVPDVAPAIPAALR